MLPILLRFARDATETKAQSDWQLERQALSIATNGAGQRLSLTGT
jgi:hypothetical protein